jgi:regulator of nucleoside diphosphate kinase
MTLNSLESFTLSPRLVLGREEHRQLTTLALAGLGHGSDASDDLLYELDRAALVPDATVPADAVRMGSHVVYRTLDGREHEVTLVFPAEADIAQGRVSVMTPVGTALIGLRQGQSITWTTRDARRQVLTVLAVRQPEATPGDDPGPQAA